MSEYPMLINGELCQSSSKKKRRAINPATGKECAEVPIADKKDIENSIFSAREAFDKGPWSRFSLSERREAILKISDGILENAQQLAQIETENTGKPIKETTFMDVPSSAKTFEHFANNLEKYLKEEKILIEAQAESTLYHEPRGVVVLIVPWNYPLIIASWKMAQALAAGNTVILKPSSLTPLTALKLGEIIHKAGLPKGVVNIINAPGADIGNHLCADPRIDMISFTGSPEVGRDIMKRAAENTKKSTMELGGKSASIILEDCDLDSAVMGSLTSIFLNQGQMCTAMSRLLVHKNIYKQFIAKFTENAKKIKLGNGADYETQMGPLISAEQRKKVLSYVEKGKKQGANLLTGGKIPGQPELKDGFFFEPTVFADVTPDMSIFQEEIFGPVVCVSEFSSEQEAIELANSSNFGLAGCIWSSNIEKAKEISKKINAGTVWINTYGMFHNEAPYGGFKQSGFGKELGKQGFLEYTRLKHVNHETSGNRPLVSCWYAFE